MTHYEVTEDGTCEMDMEKILTRYEGSEVTVTVIPGWKDITRWRDIRYKYGNSYVKIMGEGLEPETTLMKFWQPRNTIRQICKVYIRPESGPELDVQGYTRRAVQLMDALAERSDKDIEELWRLRRYLKAEGMNYIRMLKEEIRRRYECTLVPIVIKVPYVPEFDAEELKGAVVQQIRTAPWPQFLIDWHEQKVRLPYTK